MKFGLNREEGNVVYREWAPAAEYVLCVMFCTTFMLRSGKMGGSNGSANGSKQFVFFVQVETCSVRLTLFIQNSKFASKKFLCQI